jgi:hypothetical protein
MVVVVVVLAAVTGEAAVVGGLEVVVDDSDTGDPHAATMRASRATRTAECRTTVYYPSSGRQNPPGGYLARGHSRMGRLSRRAP